MINKFVDKIFIINLDYRTDRWTSIKNQLDKLNITNYERFSAYLYKNNNVSNYICGNIGCIISHYLVNKISKEREYNRILILEDDCLILENEYKKYDFQKAFDILQDEKFDMFYLGATFHKYGITNLNQYVDIINECCATHAIITNVNIIYNMFNKKYNSIDDLINITTRSDADTSIYTIDGTYASFYLKRYITNPILAIQTPSHSDITGHFSATDQYKMWKSTKEIN